MTEPAEPVTDGAASAARPAAGAAVATGAVPRLSVLMPSWNAAASIERALDSVLEERGIPLEVIVIDDGSTDGTADVVAAVADRDPRVVLIRLPANEGVSNARNRGLEVARGEWLAFLDADDRLLPGGVAALMRPTADPEVLAVVAQRIWTDGERTWLSPVYDIPDIRLPGRKSIAANPGLLYYASATGKAIHRSLLDGLRFEGRVLGDQAWTIRALLRAGDGIEVVEDTVYEWTRPHPDRYVETIGAATRASTSRAVEMAAMAPVVFLAVSEEVDRRIADEPVRGAIKGAYFDRLIRSDLGVPVDLALDRRDPETGQLFEAIARFIEAAPAAVVASSDALVARILRPPARRWRSLPAAARPSYWAMVAVAMRYRPPAPAPHRRAGPGLVARAVPGLRAGVAPRRTHRDGRGVRVALAPGARAAGAPPLGAGRGPARQRPRRIAGSARRDGPDLDPGREELAIQPEQGLELASQWYGPWNASRTRARRAARSAAGAPTISRMAAAMAAGRSGRTGPDAGRPNDRGHARQVRGHDGHARGDALEELLRRGVHVVDGRGLDGHQADVGRGRPGQQVVGRDGRQQPHPTEVGEPRGLVRQPVQPPAEAEQHQDHIRDLEDGGHRLLDPALRDEVPLVQRDGHVIGEAERLADQVRLRLRHVPQPGTVHHDGRPWHAELFLEESGIRFVHRQDTVRSARPAALQPGQDRLPRPAQTGVVARLHEHVTAVVDRSAAMSSPHPREGR